MADNRTGEGKVGELNISLYINKGAVGCTASGVPKPWWGASQHKVPPAQWCIARVLVLAE
jgi:hypothetical protein